MRSRWVLLCALMVTPAHAGMQAFTLTEAAAARLDVISFFAVVFLLCTWLTKWAWNVLAKEFPSLPKIGFKQALAMMLVSSLFLYVVLTMISGARELMTPGAWAKSGSSYQLATPDRDPKPWLESARRQALERLRDALWSYAKAHADQLPPHALGDDIERSLWSGVHPQGETFAFRPEANVGSGDQLVAYEPESYGPTRFALLSSGEVIKITAAELMARLQPMPKGGER